MRLFLITCGLVACADDFTPPPQSPELVQNIHYTTNVFNNPPTPTPTLTLTPPPTLTPTPTPSLSPTPPPPPTTTGVSPLPLPITHPPHTPEVLTRDVKPVGIASCDAYLTHVEVCSRRMLSKLPTSQDDALARIVMSLDMTRRAWRNGELTPRGRAQLAETCSDSIRLYDMGAADACAE